MTNHITVSQTCPSLPMTRQTCLRAAGKLPAWQQHAVCQKTVHAANSLSSSKNTHRDDQMAGLGTQYCCTCSRCGPGAEMLKGALKELTPASHSVTVPSRVKKAASWGLTL